MRIQHLDLGDKDDPGEIFDVIRGDLIGDLPGNGIVHRDDLDLDLLVGVRHRGMPRATGIATALALGGGQRVTGRAGGLQDPDDVFEQQHRGDDDELGSLC